MFHEGISKVLELHPDYNIDLNVSVFETNIRVLGGLLSAHILATDKELCVARWFAYNQTLHRVQPRLTRRLPPCVLCEPATRVRQCLATMGVCYGSPLTWVNGCCQRSTPTPAFPTAR